MSYDLFFKNETKPITETQFKSYFSNRKNYSINESTACYENENTGVHFVFEFGDKGESEPEMESLNISFNLNFCRPMFFIREAEPEVKALVEHFKLLVADWQVNDIETSEYDAEAFMSKWTEMNAFSYKIVLENSPETNTLPGKVLNAAWEWNYNRDELQESISDDLFVPSIRFACHQGKEITFCIWTDAIPMLVPVVDFFFFCRVDLAPRKFLLWKPTDIAVGLWSDFEPLLEKHKRKMLNGAYYLFYPQAPNDLVKAVRALPPHREKVAGLPGFEVYDREIIELQQN